MKPIRVECESLDGLHGRVWLSLDGDEPKTFDELAVLKEAQLHLSSLFAGKRLDDRTLIAMQCEVNKLSSRNCWR